MQIVNFGKSDSFIQVIWFPPEIKMTTMILLIHFVSEIYFGFDLKLYCETVYRKKKLDKIYIKRMSLSV
jgi:hypothetical protein